MGLYGFKPQFVPRILDGSKTHTIRAPRKIQDKPGKTMHLYTGLRQKGAKLLMRVPCVRVEGIFIDAGTSLRGKTHINIEVAGQTLDDSEMNALARRDGFDDLAHMMRFWEGNLPFAGHIYHWDFERRVTQ